VLRHRRHAFAAVFLLVASLIAAPGCGEGNNDDRLTQREYQAAILDIVEDMPEASGLYLDLVVERLPRPKCVHGVRALHDQVRRLIDRVASLEPPRNVAGIQQEFVAAANRSLDRVRAVGNEVAAGQTSCGQQLNNRIYGLPSSDRAERAISELEERGYHVFGN
jgi:hypothetical protein